VDEITGPRPSPITTALELVGERWSLLIIRELFYGVRRFDGIVRATGAPRNILTNRLRWLEDAGIVERELYSERPPRYEYLLTEAGSELLPVLLALQGWGETYLEGEPGPALTHTVEGSRAHRLVPMLICEHCSTEIVPEAVHLAHPDPYAV
jgi:DNA-binding HxlR family transcriptional regulator